jgi:hypothetical protein
MSGESTVKPFYQPIGFGVVGRNYVLGRAKSTENPCKNLADERAALVRD